MKRREFVRAAGLGLGGLIGLERLAKAITSSPTYTPLATCDGSKVGEYHCKLSFSCSPSEVRCEGIDAVDYGFECANYTCENEFICYDYICKQRGDGDHDCKSGFWCGSAASAHASFYCEGKDLVTAQFNCYQSFTCNPKERYKCDDPYCKNYDCSASATSSVAYAESIQPE